MSIYHNFCIESAGENGCPGRFRLRYPDNFNFGYDVVDQIARKEPGKTALIWCNDLGQERAFSFRDIRRESNKIANLLLRAGIRKGDRVIVVLKRHYEYWFTAVAIHKIEAVLIPATHQLTVNDVRFRIRTGNVRALIVTPDGDVPETVLEAVREEEADCLLWTVRKEREGFLNLTEQAKTMPDSLPRCATNTRDPVIIYYTSGTTGNPKGVVHDFTYPLAHIITAKYWQGAEEGGLHFTVADTGWGKASWGKIYGQWLVGSAVLAYDFDSFDPASLIKVINRYGVTSFCAPPTVYRYLVKRGIPSVPSLKHASTAGEALSADVFRKFTEQTGLKLHEGYGQTETALLLANFRGREPGDGSLGFPSPLFQVELRKRNGLPADQGEIGEIVVVPKESGRTEGLFSGYLGSMVEDRFAFRDGVYHTGDAAWQDAEGRFWFHSRFDDIIKTGGYRVGPREIEKILLEDESVSECSVIGIPDYLRGQAIKACIVLSEGVAPSAALAGHIKSRCNARLAEYKWVRAVEFVTALPKTISGKVRNAELRRNTFPANQT